MILGSLNSRIVVFFTLLLVLVQLIGFYFINNTSQEIAKNQNILSLKNGEMLFRQISSQNQQRLIETSNLLSADFAFREAVATNDSKTVLSVLNNHGARIKSDRMMVVSLDNQVLADTLHPSSSQTQSPLTNLIRIAEKSTEGASELVLIDNLAYQVALVPVLAPDLVAWVAIGFLIDYKLAQQFRDTTGLHVTFLCQSKQQWRLLATTQAPEFTHAILNQANDAQAYAEPFTMANFTTVFRIQQETSDSRFVTVLQRPIQESIAAIKQLRILLLQLGVLSLFLSLLGSFLLARKITRPLKMLTDLVNNLRNGDMSQETRSLYDDNEDIAVSQSDQEVDVLRRAYFEILRLAYEDILTGLPNRGLFNDRLMQMVKLSKRSGASFFVIMLDLDRFKYINDSMGHHAGDEVIKIIGSRLLHLLRESDTVARLGGDEFAILLANVHDADVKSLFQKLQQAIEQPMEIEGHLVDVSCSMGIAVFPKHGEDSATLLRHADAAMYMAKSEKTGWAVYDPTKNTQQKKHQYLLSELRKAIEENELELHYQPQIDLFANRVVAAEALVRWRHPTRGMVPPFEFINFAETSGMIRLITQWVIKEGIQQCSQWVKEGVRVKISINISARDLVDPDFTVFVEQKLTEYQLPAEMLCLEITESTLMNDPKLSLETLIRLRELGVSIAIDDFGTGYSSLAYIKNLPVSELKIDRIFVSEMTKNKKDNAIVRSTISLAHNLGIKVVAEGVENTEEAELLMNLNCDFVQGYLYSKALPSADFQRWLRESKWGCAESRENLVVNFKHPVRIH